MSRSFNPLLAPTPTSPITRGEKSSIALSVEETLKLHANCALSGFIDASRWDIVARVIAQDAEIRANVLKSTLLNTLSLVAIFAFDILIVPFLGLSRSQLDPNEFRQPEHWLHRNIGVFYTLFFQLPVVSGALYLNGTWSAVVAKRIYVLQHGGGGKASSGSAAASFSSGGLLATHDRVLTILQSNAYRAVLIMTTLTLSFVLGHVPLIGKLASFIFMCWVDAYYCFEFIWTARGHSLAQRLRLEEERWSYFFAFGFTPAAVCMWGSSLANAALFALIFPAFVIMAIQAHPVPVYPYAPVLPHSNSTESVPVQPHPNVPVRLPIFAVPLILHDIVQRVISQMGSRGSGGGWDWKELQANIGEGYGLGGAGADDASLLESVEEGTITIGGERKGNGISRRHGHRTRTGGAAYHGTSFSGPGTNDSAHSPATWLTGEMKPGFGIGSNPASYAVNTPIRTKRLD